MEIVDIFADQLFSFVYPDEEKNPEEVNEFDRLMDLWTDVSYLREYAKKNHEKDIDQFVKNRLNDAENIQDRLDEITQANQPLEYYFRPLNNNETGVKILSLQKGKVSPKDGLRLYAIKIDENCFVITGGAIKMSLKMKDHPETRKELSKIKVAQDFLKENGVMDKDSFCEFKNELE